MRNACAWLVLGCTLTLGSSTVEAQTPLKVVVSGLKAPGKMLALETGAILVSESGTGVHDSRITAFDTDGNRLTLIEGLPSGLAFPNNDPVRRLRPGAAQPHALHRHQRRRQRHGRPRPGQRDPEPEQVVAHLQLRARPRVRSQPVGRDRAVPGDAGGPPGARPPRARGAASTSGANARRCASSSTSPTTCPSRVPIRRRTRGPRIPFALEPDGSCALWLVDASRNLIWKVDICENTFSTLTTFPPTTNPTPAGPPRIDAVPTSARTWNGDLLVSFLSGAPFLPGPGAGPPGQDRRPASTRRSSPGCGRSWTCCPSAARRDGFFVLEFSRDLLAGLPGRVLWFDSPTAAPVTFADGLVTPVNMAIDPRTGDLLISQLALGRVVALPITPLSAARPFPRGPTWPDGSSPSPSRWSATGTAPRAWRAS